MATEAATDVVDESTADNVTEETATASDTTDGAAQLGDAGAAALSGEIWSRSLLWAALLLALSLLIPKLLPKRWRR